MCIRSIVKLNLRRDVEADFTLVNCVRPADGTSKFYHLGYRSLVSDKSGFFVCCCIHIPQIFSCICEHHGQFDDLCVLFRIQFFQEDTAVFGKPPGNNNEEVTQ
ncbi:unnamed protein product [Gongylonema pulchrum]|uniref:Uncharacterized protein n=1 Tax=Gongylonema pulchrum TaxID=637853 RepID=A0A183DEY4_9BILA|nr:unnamed protein product [Gongylonema pulchrum]